jgi:GNAT superfamily N-acetyltransferase
MVMSTREIEIELRPVATDDPRMLALAEALRDEVEERGAHNGVGRPDRPLSEAVKADSDTLVAFAGQSAVGMGALRLLGRDMAEIKRMYVLPEYRGAGVATTILAELERRARERGLSAVRLDTNARLVEANRMYREAGYREIADYNANRRADRWYEKPLA